MTSKEQVQKEAQFVCDYLLEHPDFFQSHPDLFVHMNFPRQNREGTRSILECQNEILRTSLTTMEVREEEFRIQEKLFRESKSMEPAFELAESLLKCRDDVMLPEIVLTFFKRNFKASHGLIRLWPVIPNYSFFPFSERLGREVEESVSAMTKPFAGENFGDDIAKWLRIDPVETRGVLLIPLKNSENVTFGLICLCDPHARKFTENYQDKLLDASVRLSEAALTRLINE